MSLFGPVPEYQRKASRVKAVIALCGAITFALVAAFVGFGAQFAKAQNVMLESQMILPGVDPDADGDSKNDNPSQTVFAPNLVSLLGKSVESAVKELEHGATIVQESANVDANGQIVRMYDIALTSEPADKMAGTPTVFLKANSRGAVIEAGYQAGMWYLGYGSLSLADAVENVHVVERVLGEAGLQVEPGGLTLPEDSASYTTYGSDGVTIVSQECEFDGKGQSDKGSYAWRAVVSYDYSEANTQSNLAYTLRKVAVFVSTI